MNWRSHGSMDREQIGGHHSRGNNKTDRAECKQIEEHYN